MNDLVDPTICSQVAFALHENYKKAGFFEDQAFQLTKQHIKMLLEGPIASKNERE